MDLVLDLLKLLLLNHFCFFFFFSFLLFLLTIMLTMPRILQLLLGTEIVSDFLHLFHQLVLGLGCVFELLHKVFVITFHAVVVLDELLEFALLG